MNSLAERMIVKEMQEKSRAKQEEIVSRNKIAKDKKQERNVSAMRRFFCRRLDSEWLWKIIAYTYFICKTLALLILISILIFGMRDVILFIIILLCCLYFNRKLLKYI